MDRNRLAIVILSAATFVAALFVPLVVKIHVVALAPAFVLSGYASHILDGFSWYKAIFLIASACFALLGILLCKRKMRFDDLILALIGSLALLSALVSPYRNLTVWGIPYLFEGLPVSLAYLILAIAARRLPRTVVERLLPWGLALSLLFIAVFGLSELAGTNLINEPSLSSWLLNTEGGISPYSAGFGAASFPFGNPNYMGMYAAMIWSFLFGFTWTRKHFSSVLLASLASATAFALLLASMCRGGYIAAGVACAIGLLALFMRRKPSLSTILTFVSLHIVAFQAMDRISSNRSVERISSVPPQFAVENFQRVSPPIPATPAKTTTFTKIFLEAGRLKVQGDGEGGPFTLLLERHLGAVKFMDGDFRPLFFKVGGETDKESEKIEILDPRFAGLKMALHDAGVFRVLTMNGIDIAITNWGFRIGRVGAFVSPVSGVRFPLPFADRAFSLRGFIWAYSLPLLKDTLVLGHGAGSFPFDFPNNDFVLMSSQFGPQGVVDKPHNFYISFAHTHGLLALILLIILITRMFWEKARAIVQYDQIARELPYLLGCIGFLVTGISVDSTIGVGAVFWILLGVATQKAPSLLEKTPSI